MYSHVDEYASLSKHAMMTMPRIQAITKAIRTKSVDPPFFVDEGLFFKRVLCLIFCDI